MQLELIPAGEQLTARLAGELDHHGAGEVREKIDLAVLSRSVRHLRLDFSGLTFMDSSGVGLIMGRYRLMTARGGTLRLIGLDPSLDRMLRMAGIEKLPVWEETPPAPSPKERMKTDDQTRQ